MMLWTAPTSRDCTPRLDWIGKQAVVMTLAAPMTPAIFPRALFAMDHRRSISFTACFMFGRYLLAATSGVIEEEKKIRLRLPSTGPPPCIGSAMALMPASEPPTEDA